MTRHRVDPPIANPAPTRATGPHDPVHDRSGPHPCPGPRTIESRDLLAGQPAVLIHHMGELYRLQTTRQGKLILTK